jgi:methylmalonic aciduria homocystinuria type C protein
MRELDGMRTELLAAGFDLVQPAQAGWYNQVVDPAYRVPDFGSATSLALIIGNTRALWPCFVESVRSDAGLAAARDPLDRYTEQVIHGAVAKLEAPCEVRFSHEPPPRRVAMQRFAHVAGLAYLSPSYLSVHPIFGPWIGLRAVVVLAGPGPDSPAPTWEAPCHCDRHCAARFHDACALFSRREESDSAAIAEDWRAWLAVRDACPVGRAHRYSEAQIEYHYTKNRGILSATDPRSRQT